MYIELENDNLGELINDNEKVIVQYGATWCGHCKLIKPKFISLSTDNEDVLFVYADAEKFPGTREFCKVTNLPTFAGFVDGQLVETKVGGKVDFLQQVLDKVK